MSRKDKELNLLSHIQDKLYDARDDAYTSMTYDNCYDDINSAFNSVEHAIEKVNDSNDDDDFDI